MRICRTSGCETFVKLSLLGNFSSVVSRVSIAGTILGFFNFCHCQNLVSPGIKVLVLVLKCNYVQLIVVIEIGLQQLLQCEVCFHCIL